MNELALESNQAFFSMDRLKTVLFLAAPILATMITQNMMGLIDIAMIGRLGDSAQAALGVGSTLFFLLMALVIGVSAGVQTVVARRIGEGKEATVAMLLNAGICLAVGIALVSLVIGYLVFPLLFPLINSEPVVIDYGLRYLRALLPCIIFAGFGMAFGGYWTGIGKPKYNLYAILVQLACNVLFNYALIFGHFGMPRLETAGAGIGTTLAACVGVLVQFSFALRFARERGFLKGLPPRSEIRALCRMSIPTSIQQFLVFLGILVFIRIVGLIGVRELAVFTVVTNILMTLLLFANGLGIASTTLVGNAMGRKRFDNAKQWGWEISILAGIILVVFGSFAFVFAEPILQGFIKEPATIAAGIVPFRIIIMSAWVECMGRVLGFSLVGAGAAATVLKITFINQWILRLPLYWLIGVHWEKGLVGIFFTASVMYILQTGIFVKIWQKDKWAQIKL